MERIIFVATAVIALMLVANSGVQKPEKKAQTRAAPCCAVEVTDEALEALRSHKKISR